MDFSKKRPKMPMGRVPIEIFGVSKFFIEILWKNIFEVGDPQNRRFWGFFQKSILEISAKWEKRCFMRSRFFWKIEEMGVIFGGAPQNVFHKFVLL